VENDLQLLGDPMSLRHPVRETARKASWNHMGVEPGSQEGLGCYDLGRVLVLIKNTRFVRDNGTNQTKEGYRGQKPVSKKLLVRR